MLFSKIQSTFLPGKGKLGQERGFVSSDWLSSLVDTLLFDIKTLLTWSVIKMSIIVLVYLKYDQHKDVKQGNDL